MPGFRGHESRLACSGVFARDLLAGWLRALSVMCHRSSYFWLTQSLSRSSQGKERWGGLSVFLVPVLAVWQIDAKDRALPSLLPSGCSLSKGERWAHLVRCWGPTPQHLTSKLLVFPLQPENDASMLRFFYGELTELSSKLIFVRVNLGVCFPSPVQPLQIPTLSFIAFYLVYSTTTPVINHRA